MDTIAVIVGAFLASIASSLLLAHRINHRSRLERELDHQRQDEVAERVAQAATDLLAANERVAENAAVTNGKLDVIHVLVNSNMSAAMQAELDATVRELAMMKEVIALNQTAGRAPSAEAVAAIDMTAGKIAELRATLQDRLKQTEVAEHQRDWP